MPAKSRLSWMLGLVALAASTEATAQTAPAPLEIQSVELWTGDTAGKDWRRVSNGAVLVRGKGKTCVGWLIRFKPVKGPLAVEEYIWFPGKIKVNRVPGARLGPTGTFLMSLMRLRSGERGAMGKVVCLGPEDPLGAYKFVISNGKPVIGRVHFMLFDRPLQRTDVSIPVADAEAIRAMLAQ